MNEKYVEELEKRVEELQEELSDVLKWKPSWVTTHIVNRVSHKYKIGHFIIGEVELIVNENGTGKTIYVAGSFNQDTIRCFTLEEAKALVEKWTSKWVVERRND